MQSLKNIIVRKNGQTEGRRAVLNFWALVFFLFTVQGNSFAQLAVTQNSDDTALSQLLAGSGVTITNVTKNCNTAASGTFTNTSSDLGLTQGVVLSTGKVTSIPQPASSFASTALTGAGDPQLSTLTAGPIYDPCILEFDIVPQGDTLQFKYVFASEEYPEFVCSQFNDVFGFFITGPNPAGGSFTNKNMAIIPNSTLPVCINAVNDGISGTYNGVTWNSNNCVSLSYTADYVNNISPTTNPYIVYNGMTVVLSAVSAVVPCQSYHLKIAIADVGDRFYDSGVFLQAYSVSSKPYTVTVSSAVDNTAYNALYEGCMGGTFTISLSAAQTSPVTVGLSISGTATNGVDYSSVPDSVTIPAGQTSVTIPVSALQNNFPANGKNVVVSILNQCSGAPITSDSLLLMNNPVPGITASDTTLCLGQTSQLTATGGKTYSWTPTAGLSNPSISNPIATPAVTTDYTANITWGTCVYQLSQTIHVSNPSVLLSVSPSDTVCTGTPIQLSASASNGILPYKFLWSNGNTSSEITSIASGTFAVTATDSYGCTASSSQSVVELNPSLIASPTNVNCYGANNGAVNLASSGGVAPYHYNWSNGSTSAGLSSAAAGSYSVTATDSKGCTATATAIVSQPVSALVPVPTVTSNVSCFNGNNGAISLSVTGGTAPYIFDWAGGVTTQNRTNLIGGTYNVTVTDNKGCTASASAIVTEPSQILSANATSTNINCFGASTGSINLTVTGGTTPYTYNWGGGITTQNRSNLGAGNYLVTITDANGCTETASAVVSQPAAILNVTLTPAGISCFGGHNGTISSNVSGGTAPYYYSWNDGASIADIANLAAGNYVVTITDAKGCSITSSATVVQPASALAISTSANNVSCFGAANGAINLTVTGGTPAYTYNWTGGITTQNRTNLTSGSYNVTVTDGKGCSATTSATIIQPAAALNAVASPTNINCFGASTGSINLTVSGGTIPYVYNWGTGIITQNRSNLAAGNYSVTVTDANGCSTVASAAVTQPTAALNATTTINSVSCFGGNSGSVSLTVSGGTTSYNYSWSNGATVQNPTNLTAGNYSVTITDAKACSVTALASITQPSGALAVSAAENNIGCFGANNGSVNLTVTGGTPAYTYNWTGGGTTQNRTNLTSGSYNVTVTDSKGCSATTSATIIQPAAALNAVASPTNINCFGASTGSINLATSGGTTPYSYNWGTGIITQNRSNLAAGNYSVTVTDANGCSTVASAAVTQPTAALNATTTINSVSCFGGNSGSVSLTVSGGTTSYNYSWSNGATVQNITNLIAGSYTVTITDAKACSVTALASITQPVAALTLSTTESNIGCFGANNGSVNLAVTGGTPAYTYNWTGGITTQNRTNLTSGSYNVTVTDSKGCSATTSATIIQPAAALNVVTVVSDVKCFGASTGSIDVTVSGGTTPYTYNWGAGVTAQNRNNLAAGNYSLTVTDANGCSATTSSIVSQPVAALSLTIASLNPVLCFGGNSGSIDLNVTGGSTPYSFAWSNGATSLALSNAASGNYSVSVTDGNMCSATLAATISEPAAALSVGLVATAVNCNGSDNGAITSTVGGGTAPYAFHWNDGSVSQNRNNLIAGNYLLVVTDANGCSVQQSAAVTQPTAALSVSAALSNVGCFGGNNGGIQLNVTGGTSPYNYKWSNGVITQNLTGLQAGSYLVTVTDANNCSGSALETVVQPASALTVSPQASNVKCFGANTGSITLVVAGGTSPYSYNWGEGVTSGTRDNLTSGVYTATVTDANGCSAIGSASITQPSASVNVSVVQNNIDCFGNADGTINTTTIGGVAPYSYAWNDGVSAANRSNLQPGNYLVTVTDANGCSSTAQGQISQPAQPLKALAAVRNLTCNESDNGAISLTVSGGTPPYFFKWDSNSTSQNRTQLRAGVYQVTVTDANGCNVVEQNTVTQPAPITIVPASSAVACFGGDNGSISLSAAGGTPAYSFNWGNGVLTQNRSQLSAGSYTVTLTDANLCTATASVSITQPVAGIMVSSITGNVSCTGGNNGTIQLNTSGGSAPYTFSWNGGETTENRNGLTAGTYTVTVSDSHGCSATASTNIAQPSGAVSVTAIASNVSCYNGNNGAVNLTVTGGTSPYSFGWNEGQRAQNITNLIAGSYSVIVNDANGCSAGASAAVTQPSALLGTLASVNNIKCFGGNDGSLSLNVSGGTAPYSFAWSNGATTQNISNLSTGIYHATITDANGCNTTAVSSIVQPHSAINATTTATGASCFESSNGNIILQVTGGTAPYTFNWGSGVTSQNRSGLTAGAYTVTVTDANLCTATAYATVTQPAAAIGLALSAVNVSCANGTNGSINLSVSGGTAPYTFNWGGGIATENRSGLSAGNYEVTVTDAKGCSAVGQQSISQPAHAVAVAANVGNEVSCYSGDNGSIDLNVSGGTSPYSYSWNGGITAGNRANLSAGTYHVTVTDINGCTAVATAIITQPASAVAVTSQITNVGCFDGATGAINITATGGTAPYNYNWGAGVTTENRNSLTAGTYVVTVTDSKGCQATMPATVTQVASAINLNAVASPTSCSGGDNGAIKLNAAGGSSPYAFNWGGGLNSQNRNGLVAGTYTVTVTDAHGCTASTSITVTSPKPIALAFTETNPGCYGGQNGKAQVSAAGGTPGYNFIWSNGATGPEITGLSSGTYSVTLTDMNGCTESLSGIVLNQPAQINVSVAVVSGSCAGLSTGQLKAQASGGTSPYQYLWSNGSLFSDISQLMAGSYMVTVTDANQCTQLANAVIADLPGVSGSAATTPLPCENAKEEIELNMTAGTGPFTFKWSDGATTENLNNVNPGTYTVTVQDANGCKFDTTFVIDNLNNFSVTATGVATINLGGSSELHATGTGSAQTVFNWTPGSTLSCVSCPNTLAQPVETTTYTVVGTDTNGCTASDTVSIIVIEDYNIFTPNAFTPNGDGNNDYFQIFGNLAGIHSIDVKIFDRWGEKVFESEEPNFMWDGTYKGVLQAPQVFAYEMKIVFNDGHSDLLKKGSITLIR